MECRYFSLVGKGLLYPAGLFPEDPHGPGTVVLNGVSLSPKGQLETSGDIFHYQNWVVVMAGCGGRLLLVAGGQRPGMLLNIYKAQGSSARNKELSAPSVNSEKSERESS